jgi:hypothetical protein
MARPLGDTVLAKDSSSATTARTSRSEGRQKSIFFRRSVRSPSPEPERECHGQVSRDPCRLVVTCPKVKWPIQACVMAHRKLLHSWCKMTETLKVAPRDARSSILSPLRHAIFRRIWTASLLSNLGLLIMGVGAAWSMTQMTASADMAALVQTTLMLPVALISAPAGAVADMFDRRKVGLIALSIALRGFGWSLFISRPSRKTPNLTRGPISRKTALTPRVSMTTLSMVAIVGMGRIIVLGHSSRSRRGTFC